MKTSHYLRLAILIIFQAATTGAFAADIARDVRLGGSAPASREGGFFELSSGVAMEKNPVRGEDNTLGVGILVGGRYQWRGLFIETIEYSANHLSLGYNLWNGDHWSLDIVGSQINTEIISKDNKELEGLRKREGDFLVGGRATGYYGNYIVQLQLAEDISDTHNGSIAFLEAGRSWQLRNWNYHALLGIRYYSKKVVNYYLGISPEEASETLPEYSADTSSIFTAEVGVTYPMTEHWVFRSTAHYETFSKGFNRSPILEDKNYINFTTTFSYVF